MMKKLFVALIIIVVFGCGQPSQDQVRADFLRANPTASIIVITAGEKSTDRCLFNISYREQNEDTIREDIWFYNKIDGQWVNTGRKSDKK